MVCRGGDCGVIDRVDIFKRVHGVVIRVELSSEGKAQSIGQNVAHLKPESISPDMQVLFEHRLLEAPLLRWLGEGDGSIMERFHAEIVSASDGRLGNLLDALGDTEKRLRIVWKDGNHHAAPRESTEELRDRMHREYLYRGFGQTTKAAAAAEGVSEGTIDYVRRCHGIRKLNGERADRCPEAVVQLSTQDYCAVCQIVDDLMQEAKAA